MAIWDLILYLINNIIFSWTEYYRNIFIFQMVFSCIPSLIVGIIILVVLFSSLGLNYILTWDYEDWNFKLFWCFIVCYLFLYMAEDYGLMKHIHYAVWLLLWLFKLLLLRMLGVFYFCDKCCCYCECCYN